MFKPVENGTLIKIPDNAFGYVYDCWIPPVGYGVNVVTGKLQEVDVIKRSEIPEEQYWERQELPVDFKVRRRREKEIQKTDRMYVDQVLEQFRRREWRRRLCGVWFWKYNAFTKTSEPVYITGLHYLYINYWKFQGKWMDYRTPDRNLFYVVRYIEEDPNSLGINEITKRKNGKTARIGAWLYERVSRSNNHHGGIQSKADDDAWEVFKKAVIHPWQKLPDFFRPLYDTMKGDDPNDELRFFASSRRGTKAEEELEGDEALNSFIDFKPSSEAAYDGPQLESYVSDETGKTKKPVSIKERQNVVRFCTEIEGEFIGRHWFTTTVEIDEGEEDNYEFQELTAMSNPLERDDNGRTMSGLYTYFLPAHKGMFFDKYGDADEERAVVFLMNTRRKLEQEGKTRELSSFKRKNPMNFKEAFSADGTHTLYDPEILSEQLDTIQWRNDLTEKGNLKWHKDSPFFIEVEHSDGSKTMEINKVYWEPDINGRFEKVAGWFPREANMVIDHNGQLKPNNNNAFRIGYDTFKYDKTKNKRRSNAAAFAYQIKDELFPSEFDDMFVLRYAFRASSRRAANMDVLMMAWYCGCQFLYERNAGDHPAEHLREWNCYGFLMFMPGETEPGITTDGAGKTTQKICEYTEQYINEHIKKVYFKTLIRKEAGWLGFKVEDTERFDEPMAAGITLVGVKGKKYIRTHDQRTNIEDLMPYRTAV